MAGISGSPLNFKNTLVLMGSLSTILLTFFMLMLTLMNQNFKGLVFIAGAVLALIIGHMFKYLFKSSNLQTNTNLCDIISIPLLGNSGIPCSSSLYIIFTFAYLFLPMQYNKQMNYGVIVGLLLLFTADTVSKVVNNCTTAKGVTLGALLGFIFGTIWYSILHACGADSLLYFNEMDSNAVRCDQPSKQTFKCSVYKNGELVSSNIA